MNQCQINIYTLLTGEIFLRTLLITSVAFKVVMVKEHENNNRENSVPHNVCCGELTVIFFKLSPQLFQ